MVRAGKKENSIAEGGREGGQGAGGRGNRGREEGRKGGRETSMIQAHLSLPLSASPLDQPLSNPSQCVCQAGTGRLPAHTLQQGSRISVSAAEECVTVCVEKNKIWRGLG